MEVKGLLTSKQGTRTDCRNLHVIIDLGNAVTYRSKEVTQKMCNKYEEFDNFDKIYPVMPLNFNNNCIVTSRITKFNCFNNDACIFLPDDGL